VIELESSLHKFNPEYFGTVDDFLSTAERNERDTLMIACADHGTAPDNVSFAGTDRFFILQHIAECVPPPEDREPDNLFGSIQAGFENYDLRHAVVCGHLGCGVIPNWLKDNSGIDTGNLRAYFYSAAVKAVDATYPDLTGRAYVERLICEHALFQLENLQANPFIREKLDANELKLHLWIVNDENARVLAFDPRRGDLVPIEEMR
jgi:carbonic anhydrase